MKKIILLSLSLAILAPKLTLAVDYIINSEQPMEFGIHRSEGEFYCYSEALCNREIRSRKFENLVAKILREFDSSATVKSDSSSTPFFGVEQEVINRFKSLMTSGKKYKFQVEEISDDEATYYYRVDLHEKDYNRYENYYQRGAYQTVASGETAGSALTHFINRL